MKQVSREVFQAEGPIVRVSAAEIQVLKDRALEGPRARARICAHPGPNDATHEMLIVLGRNNEIRPHKHPGKVESFHVIEGSMAVVQFDDDGNVFDLLRMGSYDSGRAFYYRQTESFYHTILVETDYVIFQEVTQGPFSREGTVLAPWAPVEGAGGELAAYIKELRQRIGVGV